MGVKELLGLDWSSVRGMTRKELGKVVTQLSSAANKRLRRFQAAGEESPSVTYAEKGGKFSGRGKNLNQLRSEYVRLKTFMQQEASTLRSWETIKRDTLDTLQDMGVDIPKEDFNEVMKLYGRAKEEFPDLTDNTIYAPAIQGIYDQMQDGVDPDTIVDRAKVTMKQRYEEKERANNAYESGGVSGLIR